MEVIPVEEHQIQEGRRPTPDAANLHQDIRELTVAARTGGGDAAHNPRLRVAWDGALDANMTKDTVERAIQRGTGELEGRITKRCATRVTDRAVWR